MLDSKFTAIQQPEKRNVSFATQKLTVLNQVDLNDPPRPAQSLIFIHGTKSGGTNIDFVAKALGATRKGFKERRFPVPRKPNISPSLVYPGWVGGLESAMQALETDPNCCDDLSFISGHFPFGLHQMIGKGDIETKYITLVRDPIERAISLTNFDNQRGYVSDDKAIEYLLEAEIDNPQTRTLAGQQYMDGECDKEILAKAKENIEKYFLLTGITEDVNTFIQILASIQNWGSVALVKAQVTGNKVITELSSSQIEKLTAKHSMDLELYAWVKSRWLKLKEHYLETSKIHHDAKDVEILCVTHDFAATCKPVKMSLKDIEKYNQGKSNSALIEISQHHSGLIISKNVESKEPILVKFTQEAATIKTKKRGAIRESEFSLLIQEAERFKLRKFK